jgi:hypothetical protein
MTREVSAAVQLLMRRLASLHGETDQHIPPLSTKAVFEAVPSEKRKSVLSVLEHLARGGLTDEDLAHGAGLVLCAARALWSEAGELAFEKELNQLEAA